MASFPLQSVVFAEELTTSFVPLYTVESGTNEFGIDAATFNNHTTSNVKVTIRLLRGGAGGNENEVVTNRVIRSEESFLAPSIIGQALKEGDQIEAKADTASAITAFITGTKVTD